jgi:transcriptional regulator with GAF, ATPase, and Fis domain
VTGDDHELTIDIDAGATADGWVAILIRDVTAEREMVGNEQHFRDLMEQSPMGVVICTPDGQIVHVNSAWMRAWGLDASEAARVMAEYNYLADQQIEELGVMPLVEKAFAGDPVVLPPFEYSGFRTMQDLGLDDIQPTTIWIQTHLYSIKDQQGAVENVVCINMDITDLKAALAEVAALNDRLQAESHYLQSEIASIRGFDKDIVGTGEALRASLAHVESVSHTDATVLLLGETGTGKELLARAIHRRSRRHQRPLIRVDCGTLPAGLVESELFGHEKGSFTGAHDQKTGRFELAHEGTILLDEIGELPLELQAKLLRAIEDGEIRRVGGESDISVDVRVIAATNRDLQAEVREGRFRADLYYRLSVFPITAPPLRERREDIPDLVSFFVTKYAAHLGKPIRGVTESSLDAMLAYDWPGNIRELRNVIERAVILCAGDTLVVEPSQLGAGEPALAPTSGSLKEDLHGVERARILRALEESDWKIKGDGNAASRLGVAPSTLRSRMRTLGITRPG